MTEIELHIKNLSVLDNFESRGTITDEQHDDKMISFEYLKIMGIMNVQMDYIESPAEILNI